MPTKRGGKVPAKHKMTLSSLFVPKSASGKRLLKIGEKARPVRRKKK